MIGWEDHEEFWRLFADWWNHLDGGWQALLIFWVVIAVLAMLKNNDSDVAALKRRIDKLEAEVKKLKGGRP